jgi:hypothetical protein
VSGTNGDGVCDLGDGLTHFRVNGQVFGLDVIQVNDVMDRVAEQTKDQSGLAPHLTAFADWLKRNHQVELNLGQADDLWQKVRELYVAKKKQQRETLERLARPTSPTSTTA